MSELSYRDVRINLDPGDIKASVEAFRPDEIVGDAGDGELCLVAGLIRRALVASLGYGAENIEIWVDHARIEIGADLDPDYPYVAVATPDDVVPIVRAFDGLRQGLSAPTGSGVTARECLAGLERAGAW
jgi:hypothetical protein